MSVEILIFDETGENQTRAARLKAAIGAMGLAANIGAPTASSSEALVLAHETDLTETKKEALKSLVAQRRLVIVYSAGGITSREEGGVYYRHLSEVQQLLAWANREWTLDSFRKALEYEWTCTRTHGFTALAILALGVSAPTKSVEIRKRQGEWCAGRDRWNDLLKSMPLQKLRECAAQERKSDLVQLLDWIGGGETIPKFDKAGEEAALLAG
jgi:hypothetical protein